MMDNDLVIYEVKEQIAFITMNRAEKRNALNEAMCIKLAELWERFENDANARVAILSGAGEVFCAGFDLGQEGPNPDLATMTKAGETLMMALPLSGVRVFKPIVAAVQGSAAGVGFRLAAACDLTIATENTTFLYPEPKIGRMGHIPGYVPYMLFKVTLEFMLMGEPMSAQRAYEAGMVNKVVPDDQLMNEAIRWADILKRNAPLVLRAAKFSLYKAMYNNPVYQNLFEQMEFFRPILESKDNQEGLKAYLEKRQPRFEGK